MRKLDQLIEEQSNFRDDMRVQTAIIMRLDSTMASVLTERRAMHSRSDRLARRVEKLEGRELPE